MSEDRGGDEVERPRPGREAGEDLTGARHATPLRLVVHDEGRCRNQKVEPEGGLAKKVLKNQCFLDTVCDLYGA